MRTAWRRWMTVAASAPILDNNNNWRLPMGYCIIPHPEKAYRGGEDGCFIDSKHKAFGVADGVGGYAESGINPAVFARLIMKFSAENIHSKSPVEALQLASKHVASLKVQGGCTALVAVLKDNGKLHVANLGDSGLILLRPESTGKVQTVFRTTEQQHYFNCPYQLGFPSGDDASSAESVQLQVQPGDIILAATDGCFDNLFDTDIEALVSKEIELAGESMGTDEDDVIAVTEDFTQRLAVVVATEALRQAFNYHRKSPFLVNAEKQGYKDRGLGGKVDDVTVVVAKVI